MSLEPSGEPDVEIDADPVIDDESSLRTSLEWTIGEENVGQRIDFFLALKCDGYSRMFLRRVLQDGYVLVDGRGVKPSFKVQAGQIVTAELPPPPSDGPIPEDIPLDILFEDEHIVVINKPAGMVVHPAKGHWSGTLTSALAFHFQKLSDMGGPTRPGIVHRLDRDTSGVIAIAKSNEVHYKLAAQFEARDVLKEYHAVVVGSLDRDRDWIRQPIGNHPYQRDKMTIRAGHESSRDAETFFEVIERFTGYTYVRVKPKTGRTHQIRVHLAHIGVPVLCDRLYAGHARATRGQLLRCLARGVPLHAEDEEIVLNRQALHAYQLEFTHPITEQPLKFNAPMPSDIVRTLETLRQQK
ncbi:MAG: RluA family pseudouridine synthase [Pirellulaceae bacterium]|nr:RluA family pseudouridine synthase [Pirellulaceae bacterium]